MRELLPLVAALTLIAAGAGLCLALVFAVTEEPIAVAEAENKARAIRAILPEFANSTEDEESWVENGGYSFFIARSEDAELVGVAFSSTSKEGYGGDIEVMVGLVPDGDGFKISRIEIVKHLETPGLGSKISDESFKGQFEDADTENKTLFVRKDDQGTPERPPIDAITGATISSRAVAEAVRLGFHHFLENRSQILRGGEK